MRKIVSSDEEEEDEESDEEEPPAKRAKQQTGAKRGRKAKESVSPRAGRPKGRKSTASPEVSYETKPKVSRRAPSDLSVSALTVLVNP